MSITITPNISSFQKRHFFGFFATVLFTLINQFSFAQVTTYGFSEAVSSYTPLSTSITAYAAPWDDHVSGAAFLAPLGFTFAYDGVSQTQCYISPNGFLTFGVQPASANYLPLSIASSYTGGGAIAALGMDLISGTPTDNIVYNTIGSIPNRIFVAQWTNAKRKSGGGNFNFQIRLYETTNAIEISYGVCAPDATVLSTQVGIRGVTNDFLQGDINNRLQTGANVNFTWSGKTTTGTANSSTARTSITEYPNNGLLYTYTPPANCITPSASPTAFSIGATSVNSTSFVGNSFTAATPAPTNYLIIRSTINTTPTNIDIPNRVYWAVNDVISGIYTVLSNSNSTSFTQTGLTPNTMYYYWAIPYNAGCIGGPFYKMSGILAASKATCLIATSSVSSSNVDGNSFTASWSAVTGATDYQIDVSTSNSFATTLPAYTNTSTAGATTLLVSGLNPLTTYYFRIRAVGLSCGNDSSTGSATTLCGAYSIPYSQNFDTTPVATLPNCYTVANDNLDAITWQVQNTLASSSPNSYHLTTSSVVNSDDWFFTPGLNLTGGVTYRLKFKYNTANAGSSSENLRVRMGSSATVTNMNLTLLNLSSFVNSAYQTAIVDFTPVANDIYYLGFQGYSFANQSKIVIDDISVIISPTCFEPTNVSVTTIGATTAVMTWSASVPAPSNGYNYYVSTSNTTPSNSVTPTGSVGAGVTTANIAGLLPATLYYVWVRGNCGGTDRSEWSVIETFTTDCDVPALLTVTNGTLCGGGSTTLTATGTSGSVVEWFSDAGTTNLVGTGNTFVTPTLFSQTSYWARSKVSGGLGTVGAFSPTLQGGSLGVLSTQTFISFSVFNTTVFQSIDIYPMVSGQTGIIYITDASNAVKGTYNFTTNVGGGTTPQAIVLGLNLTPGNYFLNFDTLPAAGLVINVNNGSYPYTSTTANITDSGYDNSFYLYAYNWKFSNVCRSLPTEVKALITTPPPISFSAASATICYGETTPLVTVSGYGAYNNFTWSTTVGLSGSLAAGFTFNPTTTTTYSLTAQQTSGGLCASLITFVVTVKAQPPAISLAPPTATICQGVIQPLTASLAAATASVIYSEDFNGATNGWTTINNSAGGLPDSAAWTLRPSPYFASSSNWNRTFSSNDASQFYFSDSDAQGPPSTNVTRTYLVSPTINLAGYTSANLSFWQYLRYGPSNRARVEASIDGGTTWIAPPALTQTISQGASTAFVNANVNLNSLIGNSNVKIRFYYDATYDYGWAIDNVSITGNLALEVIWSPTTGLYSDATATTPYIAGTPTGAVYAKPNTTTTYTGTALGSNGCFTSNTSVITVIPNVVTGTLTGNQTICGNTLPNNLVLSGYTGTIIRWEYATNAAFTTGLTTIANTTNTLSTAAIGTFVGDRYYRVVLQSGSCPIVYSGSVLVSFAVTAWDGTSWSNGAPTSSLKAVFNANYTSTTDLQACSVEVLSGAVVFVSTGHTFTVQNDVKVTSGTLTFDNNASLVQVNTLDVNGNTIANTGNITYIRATTPMFKFDYTYWSTPVSPQNLFALSPLSPPNLFLQFNSVANAWQYITSPSTTTMVAGKGYIFRAPTTFPTGGPATPQVFLANFVGVPNTGTITLPVTGGASQFNLLGNPYPSALSADAFLLDAGNTASLGGTIYLWTHNTPLNAAYQYSGSDYAIYNYLGGVGTGTAATNAGLNVSVPNGKIASGQGFFVKGLSSGTATFKNSMRIAGNNDHFFKMTTPVATESIASEVEKHRYWLNITNTQGALKQALIGYVETGTLGLDRLFDGEMVDVGNVISLYTMVDNTKLSIQGRPLPFDVSDVIPLGYKSTINSTYTIALSDFDGLFAEQNIYLEDKVLNVVQNLKNGSYTFTTGIGTFDGRFILKYTDSTLGNQDPVFNENTVLIYKSTESDFVINTGTFVMDSVKVFDIRGRLLLDRKGINATQTTFNAGLTNEVLLVQITTADGVKVTKKVVR